MSEEILFKGDKVESRIGVHNQSKHKRKCTAFQLMMRFIFRVKKKNRFHSI
jgi:hypothetical protein